MCIYRCIVVFTRREIFLWDEVKNVVFDAFRVGLLGLVCNRLGLKLP